MRTIEVDEGVYRHIAASTAEIGESANSILRRLLHLDEPSRVAPREASAPVKHAFSEFLASVEFRRLRNVKDRFLAVLGELHRRDPGAFKTVLKIGGRKRKYFGSSTEEVGSSGKSVAPRSIPGSPYWVMTNASTAYKGTILRQAMEALGQESLAIRDAVRALEGR